MRCWNGAGAFTFLKWSLRNSQFPRQVWGRAIVQLQRVGLDIASLCGNHYVAGFEPRLVSLSKALYHICFICGQGCKWWSHRPKVTLPVIWDVKPIIHMYIFTGTENIVLCLMTGSSGICLETRSKIQKREVAFVSPTRSQIHPPDEVGGTWSAWPLSSLW